MIDQIIPQMRVGDLNPPLRMQISDSRADADFSSLTKDGVFFIIEQPGGSIISEEVDVITPAEGGKSATVQRAWLDGETESVGHYWVRVYVQSWDQTFPDDGPLRLDIGR